MQFLGYHLIDGELIKCKQQFYPCQKQPSKQYLFLAKHMECIAIEFQMDAQILYLWLLCLFLISNEILWSLKSAHQCILLVCVVAKEEHLCLQFLSWASFQNLSNLAIRLCCLTFLLNFLNITTLNK
jgi:hypothetical protein